MNWQDSATWCERLSKRLILIGAMVTATAAQAAIPTVVARCEALTGDGVPAAAIGMPTQGAEVVDASLIPADAHGNRNGAYCRLIGVIHAQRATTPDIHFEVNLPVRWNGRALQMGGSGYSGVVVSGTEPTAFAPSASPLFLGYATFGSDSGHTGNAGLANFAMNGQAVGNFGFGHLKKTHDVALALIMQGYGEKPAKMYFAGGSTGGREAFTVIQRFPADYDGVIANAPAINFSGVRLIGVAVGRAAYLTPGGFVTPVQQKYVFETVMRECDGLDGVRDGIISNVVACRAREAGIRAALRCPAPPAERDGDTGAAPLDAAGPGSDAALSASAADCLTPAQMHTLDVLQHGLTFSFPLAYGVTRYHGYNVFAGVDFTSGLGLGDSPVVTQPLRFVHNGYLFAQADGYMKYFVAHDANFDTLHFDIDDPGAYRDRLVELSATVGGMNPDMSAFIAHGGKLIVMHGLADEVTSPNETLAYYHGLLVRYGQSVVDGFMRLYLVPGFQHGNGVFIPAWDELGALDRWVTTGVAPGTLIAADIARATNGRTRPLCPYPDYPRYVGKGSVADAANFRCTPP